MGFKKIFFFFLILFHLAAPLEPHVNWEEPLLEFSRPINKTEWTKPTRHKAKKIPQKDKHFGKKKTRFVPKLRLMVQLLIKELFFRLNSVPVIPFTSWLRSEQTCPISPIQRRTLTWLTSAESRPLSLDPRCGTPHCRTRRPCSAHKGWDARNEALKRNWRTPGSTPVLKEKQF